MKFLCVLGVAAIIMIAIGIIVGTISHFPKCDFLGHIGFVLCSFGILMLSLSIVFILAIKFVNPS